MSTQNTSKSILFAPADLAEYLNISKPTIWRMLRNNSNFPKPIRIMSMPRWTKTAVDDWVFSESENIHGGAA